MKQTIWKFTLSGYKRNIYEVSMPVGAQIFAADIQKPCWYIWAFVDPDVGTEIRRFMVVGTGWEIDPMRLAHLRTIIDGDYVWHLFECLKES